MKQIRKITKMRLFLPIFSMTGLCHQKFMSQFRAGITAIQERWFQQRKLCKTPLDSLGKNLAACLGLQVLVTSDVVGIGMCIYDGFQRPPLAIQHLPHLAARVLVVAAVDQHRAT